MEEEKKTTGKEKVKNRKRMSKALPHSSPFKKTNNETMPVHPFMRLPPEMQAKVLSHASLEGCRLRHLMQTCKLFNYLITDNSDMMTKARLRRIVFKRGSVAYEKKRARKHGGYRKHEKAVNDDCCWNSNGVRLSQLMRHMKMCGMVTFKNGVLSDNLLKELSMASVSYAAKNVRVCMESDRPEREITPAQLMIFFEKVKPTEIMFSGRCWNSFLTDELLSKSAGPQGIQLLFIGEHCVDSNRLPRRILSDATLDQLVAQKALPKSIALQNNHCGFTPVGIGKLLQKWIETKHDPVRTTDKATCEVSWDFGRIDTDKQKLSAALVKGNVQFNPIFTHLNAPTATIVANNNFEVKRKIEVKITYG